MSGRYTVPPTKIKHGVREKITKVNPLLAKNGLSARRNFDQPPNIVAAGWVD